MQAIFSALMHLHGFGRGVPWLSASPDRLRRPPFPPCDHHNACCWPFWLAAQTQWPLRIGAALAAGVWLLASCGLKSVRRRRRLLRLLQQQESQRLLNGKPAAWR